MMTKEEIIKMLRASCDKDRVDPEQNGFWVIVTEELEAFVKLVAAAEREACALLCYEQRKNWDALACADAIRAGTRPRGQE